MDLNSLLEMDVASLREIAEKRGLSVTGNKQQLAKRIFEHVEANPEVTGDAAGGDQPNGDGAANENSDPAADPAADPAPEAPAAPAAPAAEVTEEAVAAVEEAPNKFRVTPKNGVSTIVGGHGVPAEGILVPEGHPVLKFDYFLNIEELDQ